MASRRLLALPVTIGALALGACGSQGIQLADDDPNYEGAEIFNENCAGCHSLSVAGADGSATDVGSRERRDGPNFNERREDVEDVLYAIRNGGFSSQPMPQNIVTGEEAQKVAEFVARYSGGRGSE
jgi:mono/diheme cytochrome c family protein